MQIIKHPFLLFDTFCCSAVWDSLRAPFVKSQEISVLDFCPLDLNNVIVLGLLNDNMRWKKLNKTSFKNINLVSWPEKDSQAFIPSTFTLAMKEV